jgi:hypothetical protein
VIGRYFYYCYFYPLIGRGKQVLRIFVEAQQVVTSNDTDLGFIGRSNNMSGISGCA